MRSDRAYSVHPIVKALLFRQRWSIVPKRIMVVDDNPAIRRVLKNILEFNDGWLVCGEAVDGRDAIEKAPQLNPDLIVLDVSMPVMNGLEAARVLHQVMPHVPLILCSLHTDDILRREAVNAGVNAVVSKAQNMQTLIHRARELLNSN
jgi:CheY-like chemotaxis protein